MYVRSFDLNLQYEVHKLLVNIYECEICNKRQKKIIYQEIFVCNFQKEIFVIALPGH